MVRKYISVWYIELIFVLPALFLGMLVMQKLRVPSIIYLQNIIAVFFCWLLSCIFLVFSHRTKKNIEYLTVLLILVVYILTLLNEGVDGVHRWIALGSLDFHVSSILSPLLIILLWNQFEGSNNILTIVVIVSVSFIILLQPDAAQITALAGPMIIMLYKMGKNRCLSYGIILIVSIMCIASWIYLDSLPPVIYVEGIYSVLASMGTIWAILGILALILIPMPFFILIKEGYELLSVCVGLYFILTLISSAFGNFPVIVMGYGISPIIGYFIAMTWLLKKS